MMKRYRIIKREFALLELDVKYVVQESPGDGIEFWNDIDSFYTRDLAFKLMNRINELGGLTRETIEHD